MTRNLELRPESQGDAMRSRMIQEQDMLPLWEARKDITLEELRAGLAKIGRHFFVDGLHRFFVRRDTSRKKLLMPSRKTCPRF